MVENLRRTAPLILALGGAVVLAVCTPNVAAGAEPAGQAGVKPAAQTAAPAVAPADAAPSTEAAAPPAASAGFVAYLDPKTGKLTSGPPAGGIPLTPALREALRTSSAGLVEVRSTVPGGGYMVDLKGRFQSMSIVTRGADGKAVTSCITSAREDAKAPAGPAAQEASHAH